MVEPQADLILKMMRQMRENQAEMLNLNECESPYMAERAQKNVQKVENF